MRWKKTYSILHVLFSNSSLFENEVFGEGDFIKNVCVRITLLVFPLFQTFFPYKFLNVFLRKVAWMPITKQSLSIQARGVWSGTSPISPANFRVSLPRGPISAVHGILSVARMIRLQITVDWQHQLSGFYDRCILVHVIAPCLGILLLSNDPSFLQKSPFFINTKISSLTSNLPGLLNWRKSNLWKDGFTSW